MRATNRLIKNQIENPVSLMTGFLDSGGTILKVFGDLVPLY
jgi:hypothetical protein